MHAKIPAMIHVEVCIDSLPGAQAAGDAGAHGVELCSALSEGGLTPSTGVVELVCGAVQIETVVMIRPRSGDFLYSPDEYEVMCRDVEAARKAGASGVALGILCDNGTVDTDRTGSLVELARPMNVTFHRAFDMVSDPQESLECLASIGVDRVLTSGLAPSSMEALDLLRSLVSQAADRIVVVAAGGVNEGNVRDLVDSTGIQAVHFSASEIVASEMTFRNDRCTMGTVGAPGEYEIRAVDQDKIRRCVAALR